MKSSDEGNGDKEVQLVPEDGLLARKVSYDEGIGAMQ